MPSIAVEQAPPEQAVAGAVREHVLRLVEKLLRLGLDGAADPVGFGRDPGLLRGGLGEQHLDGLAPPRLLALADGLDPLLGLHRLRPRRLGPGLGGRFLQRLGEERDRLVHGGAFDVALPRDLQLAQVALATDPRLVEPPIRRDAGALDLLVRARSAPPAAPACGRRRAARSRAGAPAARPPAPARARRPRAPPPGASRSPPAGASGPPPSARPVCRRA